MIYYTIFMIISIIIILPLLVLSIFSLSQIIASNKSGEYIKITNIAFAIFAGIATLMFNWARSLDVQDFKHEIDIINKIGEYGIIGGIGYIIASLFQFINTLAPDTGALRYLPDLYISIIPLIINAIFVITSIFLLLILVYIIWMFIEVRNIRKGDDKV